MSSRLVAFMLMAPSIRGRSLVMLVTLLSLAVGQKVYVVPSLLMAQENEGRKQVRAMRDPVGALRSKTAAVQ